jgi:alkylation response protein AidB-like acyl-CoA dehydrogenase
MAADLVIVAAETDDGLGLFVIETTESGVSRRSLATLDLTRRLAEFVFRSASATRLAVSSDTGDVVRMVLDRAVLALGSEQVGGAQECLDMAVAYARSREQFGRAIGSFQAVKHRCADMLLEVEGARALVGYTAWAADNNDELPVLAGLVKATCSEAFVKVAADNIQIHGGMGFTWEHAAHLFHKRALGSAQLLGSAEQHRDSFLSRSPSLSG